LSVPALRPEFAGFFLPFLKPLLGCGLAIVLFPSTLEAVAGVCLPRGPAPSSRGLRYSRLRRQWRADLIWRRSNRSISPRGRLRRSHPQGREAGGPASTGADQIQIGHQSKDGQIAWPHYPNDVARHRRRGDRMIHRRADVGDDLMDI